MSVVLVISFFCHLHPKNRPLYLPRLANLVEWTSPDGIKNPRNASLFNRGWYFCFLISSTSSWRSSVPTSILVSPANKEQHIRKLVYVEQATRNDHSNSARTLNLEIPQKSKSAKENEDRKPICYLSKEIRVNVLIPDRWVFPQLENVLGFNLELALQTSNFRQLVSTKSFLLSSQPNFCLTLRVLNLGSSVPYTSINCMTSINDPDRKNRKNSLHLNSNLMVSHTPWIPTYTFIVNSRKCLCTTWESIFSWKRM